MKVLFFAIIIFIGAVGCSSSRPDIENNDVITISLPELPEKRLDDIDIKLVRLETLDDVLVGAVQSLVVSDKFIFIFDWNNNFFIFDRNGRFVYKSRPIGRGPKEFLSISKFFVDIKSNKIFVYDAILRKMLVYDSSGNCVDEIRDVNDLFSFANEISFMNDGRLIANLVFSPELSDYYAIISSEGRLQTESFLMHYPYKWERLSHYAPMPKIATNSDGTRLLSILSDTIYRVVDSQIVPEYVFDSGRLHVSGVDFSSEMTDFGTLMQHVSMDDKYTKGLSNILLTDKIGCSSYYNYRDRLYHVFWNLETGDGYMVPQFAGGATLLEDMKLMTATSESFVGIVYPYDISSDCIEQDTRLFSLRGINLDDNPIVAFYNVDKLFEND